MRCCPFVDQLQIVSYVLQDLVVRLCFVLGNLTSRDDIARSAIYFTCHGMDSLMHVFSTYIELDEQVGVV